MNARQRYVTSFFALGWLILVGVIVQRGFDSGFGELQERFEDRLTRLGQFFSDSEGRALADVRGSTRKEALARMQPFLGQAALADPQFVLAGAYDGGFPLTTAGLVELENRLGHRFPIISFYQAWGDKPDQRFPLRMMETIDRLGSVPMLTWEPWVTDFDSALRPHLPRLPEREFASLAAIGRGDYDFFIVPWAAAAARFGKPILLRFAHEMNDPYRYPWGPQNGNRPEDFIAAWKHLHTIFEKMNAQNVLWVWSPHISMPWFEFYYPGPAYVDWIATGVLNYGNVAPWSRWWSFEQIFNKAYPRLEGFGKPIMVAEFSTLTSGGNAAEWYRQAFHSIDTKYRRIRAVVLFNQTRDVTLSMAPLNWSPLQNSSTEAAVESYLGRLAERLPSSPATATPIRKGDPE